MSEILKRFDVFNKMANEDFLSKIHIVCVTENDSIKALIVDSDDDVYVIGKDYNENFEPFKLNGICKSGVCDFSFGKAHVVALTEEGAAFAWGQNEYHQCGNGGKAYLKVPIQIKFAEMNLNEKIKTIKCGWDHTLALTDSGSLYAWGRNYTAQCGTGTRDNVKFPEKLVIGKVKSIACGAGHSMALLENGQVFGWGENGDGQLGLGRETHCERNPTLVVELNGIKTLACGMYHTLALSSSGHLYSCGYNDYGQLGIGNKERRHTPQMVESHIPFTDIAALWCKQISSGRKENRKYYVWGRTKLGDWERPTETNCSSFNEAFTLHIVSLPVTYQCFVLQENGPKTRNKSIYCTIGKINFNFTNKIGSDPYGSRVFEGLFNGDLPVAVKRFDYFEMEDNEIKTLLSLHHQNVVRVYTTESDDNLMFRYIAMELADMSFADYIGRKYEEEFRGSNSDIIFLKQIAKGLKYLHSKNIIHSNIRPQNALISSPMWPNSDRKAMISDFAFEKELAQKPTSMIFRTDDGWMAREILRSKTKTIIPTKEMDIFALGCLFYYVLNDGKHPFGGQFYRQANILNDRPKMVELKNENSLCKYHLIQAMINKEPSNRPSMNAVLKHPIFWDSEMTLSFIVNVSNFLMEEKKKKDSPLLINLEKNATVVTRNNWMNHIPEELKVELQSDRHRSYNESSVQNLLRMIRNKYQHWGELNDEVKQALGSMPDGYVTFFTEKFPRLLIHTYIIFQNNCKKENTFKDYFCDSFDFQDLPTANLGDST